MVSIMKSPIIAQKYRILSATITLLFIARFLHSGAEANDPSSVINNDPNTNSTISEQIPEADRRTSQHEMQVTGRKKNKESLMSRILPMMVMPFLISSTFIPMMLMSLKFMLLKSLFVGKIAIVLLALNALWKSENRGGVYSHNINIQPEQKDLHMNHYGFNGDEEYGAYVNGRRKREEES